MLESKIEAYLRQRVKDLGGIAYKFTSPGNSGVPDRLVLLPGNRTVFVELKAPGKKPRSYNWLNTDGYKRLGMTSE